LRSRFRARAYGVVLGRNRGLSPVVWGLTRRLPPGLGICPVIARTVQGMARVRSGQAPAWPLVSDRSVRRGSGVKRDFACTFTRHLLPVRVVLRSQSCLRLEGRARTLSGPSPDLSPAGTSAPSARYGNLLIRSHPCGRPDPFRSIRDLGLVSPGCPGGSEPRPGVYAVLGRLPSPDPSCQCREYSHEACW
jgi:hypothetical protein